jgi:DNA excision repair protein ERCC-3
MTDDERTADPDPDLDLRADGGDGNGGASTEEVTDADADADVRSEARVGVGAGAGADIEVETNADADAEDPTADGDDDPERRAFYDTLDRVGRPVIAARDLATFLGVAHAEAEDLLCDLPDARRMDVSDDPVVWYPDDLRALVDRERVIVFEDSREVVVDHPEQFTLAQLSQFARLITTNGDRGYRYRVEEADVWGAPYDDLGDLILTMRDVLGRQPALEEYVESQWKRARKFTLRTEDDYTVLEAASEDLMGNVAAQKLDDEVIHGLISDTKAWVHEGKEAEIKRVLYEAGYPVRDDRDLDAGDDLPIELDLDLREYQRDWVGRFLEREAGVLVGPPGSGKTVAAMGIMEEVEGETLVLVPSRELAGQWREELLTHTNLTEDQVGEYHGGRKQLRPVTVATYQTAGMDRHRTLFDSRRWGLIIYDEVQHVPAPVYRRSAQLQSKRRVGLSATAVREDDKETEIFTLIGPPIGTDWTALFEAGYVAEPEVEIRYVPWSSDEAANEYVAEHGHGRRMAAATNPAKVEEIRRLLRAHSDAKALVFVDYLDQGRAVADALDAPFISGDTRHAERARLFGEFRRGERERLVVSRVGDEGIDLPDAELAVIASGLGGSRRQGTQRAGRTMRPVGRAKVYVLATRGTEEEDFARQRTRHLAGKGVRVTERDAVDAGTEDADSY